MRTHPDLELLEEIGHGPNTVVWRGKDLQTNEDVAVKELTDAARADPDRQAALRQAAQFLSGLKDYRNIIRVLRLIPENDWLVLELADGNLATELEQDKSGVPAERVSAWLHDALEGLAALHRANKVHGGIKPSNLLLDRRDPDGRPRIKIADSPSLFVGGVVRPPDGTNKYLAPERVDPS